MFMRRDAINEVGYLDTENYPLWGCTAEWQLRACRYDYEALPVKPVPGMYHERDAYGGKSYGSSITTILEREPDKRGYFIRTPPMISVVVPCFNHGRYLQDLVNSLLGGKTPLGEFPPQSFQSFEIILVDDASSDDTWEYMQELVDPWKGIRAYQHKVNSGTAAANNTGAKRAYGKFLTFISADDMMEPDRLERLYKASLKHEGKVIYDDMFVFTRDKRSKAWAMRNYDFELLLTKNHMHAGIFFPRKAWEEVGGYPELMNKGREDWAFNVRLGIHGWCGHHLSNYAGYLYRREGQNRTLTNTNPVWRSIFLNQMVSLFGNIYAGERPMGCCGGRRRNQPKTIKRRRSPMALPGSEGMVLIEYLEGKHGIMSFYGPVTGTRYTFGGSRKVSYVDAEDAAEMVGMVKNRKSVFRYFEAKKKKKVEVRKVAAKDEAPEAVPVDDVPVFDPGAMSISELTKALEGISNVGILEEVHKQEQVGKARVGALRAINAAIKDAR
jgi:glycosyltransferase involved in cell wall biosynthesis